MVVDAVRCLYLHASAPSMAGIEGTIRLDRRVCFITKATDAPFFRAQHREMSVKAL